MERCRGRPLPASPLPLSLSPQTRPRWERNLYRGGAGLGGISSAWLVATVEVSVMCSDQAGCRLNARPPRDHLLLGQALTLSRALVHVGAAGMTWFGPWKVEILPVFPDS